MTNFPFKSILSSPLCSAQPQLQTTFPSFLCYYEATFLKSYQWNELRSYRHLCKSPGLDFVLAVTNFICRKEEIYSWMIMQSKATMFLELKIIFLFLKRCSLGAHLFGNGLSKVERKTLSTPAPPTPQWVESFPDCTSFATAAQRGANTRCLFSRTTAFPQCLMSPWRT